MHHLFKSIILLLLVVPPSGLYAIGMGGMQGLVDEVSIQTKNVGAVSFSHSLHSSMTCNMCHPKIFQKKRSNSLITMKAMQKGQSCGACHNGKIVFSVTGSCATCHAGDLAFETKSVGKVPFSHDVHSEMFGCDECHPDLYQAKRGANKPATMAEMEAGDSCGACHDGATAFGVAEDCTSCHAGDIVYKDENAGNIVFPHAAHIEMFGCDECHPDLYQAKRGANKPATMADMEAGDSCGACHDGATAFGVAEDCEACHAM